MCLAYIIKFVDDDKTLLSLLMLNKETSRVMSRFVCRQALINSSQENLVAKRTQLWLKLLDIDLKTYESDYKAHKLLAE